VSDFFTPPPPREPEPDYTQPPWLGPPANELGVPVALRALLARTEELPDDVLRFGFELADGRRVTNIGHFPGFEDQPEGPILIQRGGGGGGRSWSFGY